MTKVLDVESSLEPGCEETSKGRNKGSEPGQGEEVELVGRVRHGRNRLSNLPKRKIIKIVPGKAWVQWDVTTHHSR